MRKLLAFTRLIGLLRQAPLLAVQPEQMLSNPVREAAGPGRKNCMLSRPAIYGSNDNPVHAELEVHMSRLGAAIISFVLMAASVNAQTDSQAMILSGLSDCIRDAIATSSVKVDGDMLIFSCSTAKAKTLYNFLGNKIPAEVVLDRNGKFDNRQFGNNACYHRVEDQSGKAADDFRCDLFLTIGDKLSE